MKRINFHHFQCLDCKCGWLTPGGAKEDISEKTYETVKGRFERGHKGHLIRIEVEYREVEDKK